MPYIANTEDDTREMLDVLGLKNISDLFHDVPENLRYPELELPPGQSELEVLRQMQSLAAANRSGTDLLSFLGGGVYEHFIPAVVPYLASRGEFATTYTPYQAEASQGTLQSMFEYQSMMCGLYGVDVVNASHYDGSTAFAEAALMSLSIKRKRSRIVLAPGVHPDYRHVLDTYTEPLSVEIVEIPESAFASDPKSAVADACDDNTACVLVQSPDFFGRIFDYDGLAAIVHDAGALFVMHADPVSLALFRSPADLGADIVTGDGQPLGIPPSFGGPFVGIFGCRIEHVRRMPGRLVGETTDIDGRRGYTLTLNTREQHIRRSRATSNICTNQGLMALRSAIHLAALGPEGLREVARLTWDKSHYAASEISQLPGYSLEHEAQFFREFAVRTPVPARTVVNKAIEQGMLPGIDLGTYATEWSHTLLVSVTEMRTRVEIDRLVEFLGTIEAE